MKIERTILLFVGGMFTGMVIMAGLTLLTILAWF